MSPWLLALFPLIGALIGWCTNWLAVKMIFHPREERRILGLRVQGLLPRRRGDLAENVASTVEQDLLSMERIREAVTELVSSDRVQSMLHERIDRLIDEQMKKLGPMVRAFVSADLVGKIKERIEAEVLDFVGRLSGELHDDLEKHLDVHGMVRSKIEGFDLRELEAIVHRIAAQELRHIEILGGVLGFLVGLAQVGLIILLGETA